MIAGHKNIKATVSKLLHQLLLSASCYLTSTFWFQSHYSWCAQR